MSDEHEAHPKPCPRCGSCELSIRDHWFYDGRELKVTKWVECRRWFGLKLCRRGPSHTNLKGWGDLAHRCAIEKWNTEA